MKKRPFVGFLKAKIGFFKIYWACMFKFGQKKTLYEVLGTKSKTTTEPLRPPAAPIKRVEIPTQEPKIEAPKVQKVAKWPKKPTFLQINNGRVEFSLPYQLVIAIMLGLVLIFLVVYRLGQRSPAVKSNTKITKTAAVVEKTMKAESPVVLQDDVEKIITKGDNRIVIKQYQKKEDLVPVVDYFAKYGIETEIRQRGSSFFLVTKNLYQNPNRPGTDGFLIRQKIDEVGRNYKAPQGLETFSPNFFSDSYGEKGN